MTSWSSAELSGHVRVLDADVEMRRGGRNLPPRAPLLGVQPCACGVTIAADPMYPMAEVAAHNASPRHQAWWARVQAAWQGEETDA